MSKSSEVDHYIEQFPGETQRVLQEIRSIINRVVPEAEETISYQIPTFKFNKKNLVHFAGYKKHVGLYPTPSAIEAFKESLSIFETAKGSVKFYLNEPVPYEIIEEIVKFRYQEEQNKI